MRKFRDIKLVTTEKEEIIRFQYQIITVCSYHVRVSAWPHATMECGFTLTRVHDMVSIYNQMHHTDKYSQNSSLIWPVCLNGWDFVYELSVCGLSPIAVTKLSYKKIFSENLLGSEMKKHRYLWIKKFT